MTNIGLPRRSRRRGATQRRRKTPSGRRFDFDRWLDGAVDIAVITALVVGGVALVLHLVL